MNRFLATIRFLTILPLPGTAGTGEFDLAGSLPFFPAVGLLLGGLAAALGWGLLQIFPPLLVCALLVVIFIAFSGGLHIDGLSDTADGLLSSRSRERMLEIMRDSHVGALGVVAIAGVLLVKFAALASLRDADLLRAAFLTPLAGRCAMVWQITLLPYVREKGLGAVFSRSRSYAAAVWSGIMLVLIGWLVLGGIGFLIGSLGLALTLLLAVWFHRKIGGATGDTYGATCEIAELAPALVLAALHFPGPR
jgi:adenosylcobinamide-GDP ribazoletransferase